MENEQRKSRWDFTDDDIINGKMKGQMEEIDKVERNISFDER